MRRWTILCAVLVPVLALLGGGLAAMAADDLHECDSPETERRIKACTELIETPGIGLARLATAYANRALAFSLRSQYETSIRDYNEAIRLVPEFAVALNNRAWAYFKWGRTQQAMPDVQRSLQLDPMSPHSLDTRAHIHQWQGDQPSALRDYDAAMVFGGTRMVTLYQCGLKMNRLYSGPTDGVVTPEVRRAMQVCVGKGSDCDPLPPDEDCREATS